MFVFSILSKFEMTYAHHCIISTIFPWFWYIMWNEYLLRTLFQPVFFLFVWYTKANIAFQNQILRYLHRSYPLLLQASTQTIHLISHFWYIFLLFVLTHCILNYWFLFYYRFRIYFSKIKLQLGRNYTHHHLVFNLIDWFKHWFF